MSSNLSCIGFTFPDGEAFQTSMLELAAAGLERIDGEAGTYVIWRSRTGAEIWFHVGLFGSEDDARDIVGLTPWLEGDSEIALELLARVERPDDNAFEGAFDARVDTHRVQFEAVDFGVHAGRPLPLRCTARLTLFAHTLAATGGEQISFTASSSRCRIGGRVEEHRRLVNEASGGAFDRLLVATPIGKLDVVADPAIVRGELHVGERVVVEGLLFGRLLD